MQKEHDDKGTPQHLKSSISEQHIIEPFAKTQLC